MEKPRVRVYTDYKSPYAFVANQRLFELEEQHGVELEWLPYTLRIAEFMGTVEERTPHFWRKVRYAYMDARRYANAQGLTMKGPRRIYDAFYSSAGMLFAQRHGLFRPYHDTVFRRFWSHDLDIDELSDISGVIASIGGSPGISRLTSTARRAPSMTASSAKPRRLACSACRRWCSTASCSGAATASIC
jgi:2-hydroxychromene-2-carboxylate isomerase